MKHSPKTDVVVTTTIDRGSIAPQHFFDVLRVILEPGARGARSARVESGSRKGRTRIRRRCVDVGASGVHGELSGIWGKVRGYPLPLLGEGAARGRLSREERDVFVDGATVAEKWREETKPRLRLDFFARHPKWTNVVISLRKATGVGLHVPREKGAKGTGVSTSGVRHGQTTIAEFGALDNEIAESDDDLFLPDFGCSEGRKMLEPAKPHNSIDRQRGGVLAWEVDERG